MLSLTNFLKKIETPDRPISVLLGNGLGLSHPDQMVRDGFTFDFESVSKKYQQHFMEERLNCPEEFLGYRRELLLYYILKEYIQNHPNPDLILQKNIHYFFDLFNDIYTINYDLITYWVIIKAAKDKQDDNSPYKYYIVDGFDSKALDFNQLKQRLTTYNSQHKVFFLHGAYHLYHWPECNLFEKIVTPNNAKQAFSSSKSANLIKYVERAFEDYKKSWFEREPEKVPLIVMESKWHYKKAAIAMNDYLNLGLQHLQVFEGDIFAYGCSFAKDDHILETLLSNNKLRTLYISVRHNNFKRQADIEKKIAYFKQRILNADNKHTFPDICWVTIHPEEQHLIWEMGVPDQAAAA